MSAYVWPEPKDDPARRRQEELFRQLAKTMESEKKQVVVVCRGCKEIHTYDLVSVGSK